MDAYAAHEIASAFPDAVLGVGGHDGAVAAVLSAGLRSAACVACWVAGAVFEFAFAGGGAVSVEGACTAVVVARLPGTARVAGRVAGASGNLPLHVAEPSELYVPAQPFESHDWRLPQVLLVGLQPQVANFPLHVAWPLESKVPAHPFVSQD